MMSRRTSRRCVLAAAGALCLAGCSAFDATVVDTPKGTIQRALAFCGEKTEAAETACVRQALTDAHLGVSALAALIPGCAPGRECALDYRTRDRIGLIRSAATDYIFDWRVAFDFKAAAANHAVMAADVPFKVQQI